jgi:hypothetical protein
MKAYAMDILGDIPPLDLSAYSYIEICGFHVEIRDGDLTIRRPSRGGLLVKPIVSNQIAIRAEQVDPCDAGNG